MRTPLFPDDTDARLLYDTEDTLHNTMRDLGGQTVVYHNSTLTVPHLETLPSMQAVNEFLQETLKHPDIVAAYPVRPPIRARYRRRTKSTNVDYFFPATINFPYGEDDWAFSKPVLLHELAHHLTFHNVSPYAVAHGSQFRAVNHHLVSTVISAEAAHMLWSAYLAAGLVLDREMTLAS